MKNIGKGPLPNASFTDDLSAVLDKSRLVSGPKASHGRVRLQGRVLHWSGSLRPGESAVIEYTVLVRHRGKLPNRVVSTAPRTNCPPHGRHDPRCSVVVRVVPGRQKDLH